MKKDSQYWHIVQLIMACGGLFFFPFLAHALEIYSFVDKQCRIATGQIVNVTSEDIHLLTIEGTSKIVSRSQLNHILIYNLLNNPSSQLDLTQGSLRELLLDVYLVDHHSPHFTGWATSFIENIVVFYDLNGHTYFIDVDRIIKVRTPQPAPHTRLAVQKYEIVHLSMGRNLPECGVEESDSAQTQPTRMLSDQIRISQFLSRYQKGFEELTRFQYRTQFYARPFLFEKQTLLGIILFQPHTKQELGAGLPLYFQWSNGKPYSHQSEVMLGTNHVPVLPNIEPMFAIQTEVKSHFFNGLFIGNPWATAAGKSFLIQNRFLYTDFFQTVVDRDVYVSPHFNYLAITGADWGAYSIAGGVFYPVFAVHANRIFREILASQASPLLRMRLIRQEYEVHGSSSVIKSASKQPDESAIRMIYSQELKRFDLITDDSVILQNQLQKFQLDAHFLRLGADYFLDRDMKVGTDVVWLQGTYSERYLENVSFDLEFDNFSTSLFLKHRFGNYVTLRVDLNYFIRTHHYEFNHPDDASDQTNAGTDGRYSLVAVLAFAL